MQVETGFEAAALAVLTRYESWTSEEVKVLVAQALRDAKDPKIHALFDLYVFFSFSANPPILTFKFQMGESNPRPSSYNVYGRRPE